MAAMCRSQEALKEKIETAFKLIDKDKNGSITKKELGMLLGVKSDNKDIA